jgi:hypothetical protein
MIAAAREAGDLATEGRPTETKDTLPSLGIESHFAAYCVRLAGLPCEVWGSEALSAQPAPHSLRVRASRGSGPMEALPERVRAAPSDSGTSCMYP